MIKHLVMLRLKEQAENAEKNENALILKKRLDALTKKISEIHHLEVGLNILDDDQASDLVIYSEFHSWVDLNTYNTHPAHQEVVAFIKKVVSERRVVDYED